MVQVSISAAASIILVIALSFAFPKAMIFFQGSIFGIMLMTSCIYFITSEYFGAVILALVAIHISGAMNG